MVKLHPSAPGVNAGLSLDHRHVRLQQGSSNVDNTNCVEGCEHGIRDMWTVVGLLNEILMEIFGLS